jgi:hypothetical protein
MSPDSQSNSACKYSLDFERYLTNLKSYPSNEYIRHGPIPQLLCLLTQLHLRILTLHSLYLAKMKTLSYFNYALLACAPLVDAHPGMGEKMMFEMKRAANKEKRAASKELIGDLATLADSKLTSIGKDIKAIITDQKSAESQERDTSIPAGNGCRMR